ncbi:MAG: SRPBCC domain-containing protein [Flavobacteriales bacterium]|nr:SRPBCC domain-containing protein [Flavobacteriales bacterium]HRH70245.1 SRPBCC domain-containing protein [Flavobacteriales bacterium]
MTTKKPGTTVSLTLLVDAPAGIVWKALVDPKLVGQYMLATPCCAIERGKEIKWFARKEDGGALLAKGMILAVQPSERLRFTTYAPSSKLPDEPASHTTVDVHLVPETEKRTRVELWQGDFAGLPQDVRRAREAGRQWVEQLVGLKRVAEEIDRAMAA